MDNWSLILSYANANTKVKASSDPARVGDPLVDEVPDKLALWSVFDMKNGWALGGGLVWTDERVRPTAGAAQAVKKLNGDILRYDAETRLDLFAKYDWNNWKFSLNLRIITKDVNFSNNVPRVPTVTDFVGHMSILVTNFCAKSARFLVYKSPQYRICVAAIQY